MQSYIFRTADLRSDALKVQAYMNGARIVPADSLKCLLWLFKRHFGSIVLHSWLWIEFNLSVSRPRGHGRHVDGCFHTSRHHRKLSTGVQWSKNGFWAKVNELLVFSGFFFFPLVHCLSLFSITLSSALTNQDFNVLSAVARRQML